MNHDFLSSLETKTLEYFKEICKIPHGSFNEKQLSDYLRDWGKSLGLKTIQDSHNNVVICKAASEGKELADAVILQAHIDMVCEKAPDYVHDFKKDTIPWQIDGDIMSTGGKTTLGADDGIGAAIIMALLESKEAVHPRIEAVFTTAEEEDLSGALSIDGALFTTSRMINIDHGVDSEVVLGSCGGTGAEIVFDVEREEAPAENIFRN
ncbi:MAG: hypothetical protein RR091_01315, partial [Cloacibacillus sp.]